MDRYATAKELFAKVPGVLESALFLRHRLLPPSQSEFSWNAFPTWLEELNRVRPAGNQRHKSKVLLFGMNDNMCCMILAMAIVLLSRDCEVDFAFLPFTDYAKDDPLSVIKANRFHYWSCLRGRNIPGLRFVDVSTLPMAPSSEELVEQSKKQSLMDVKWTLLREELDLEGSAEARQFFDFRMRRNLDCMRRFSTLLGKTKYDAIITLNGSVIEFGALHRMGQILGKPVTSFDFGERLETILYSSRSQGCWIDTSRLWAEDAPHTLTAEAQNRIKELIATRQGTQWGGFTTAYQTARYEGATKTILEKLKIRNDSFPIVLVCPNIAWDTLWQGLDCAFPSMLAWLRQTVAYFAGRPEYQVIVRSHPAERSAGTAEPVVETIRAYLSQLPDHIHLIGPDDPINTYDLMDISDLGLVHSSTAGLEMALRGIPVIMAAQPHYSGKGFTTDVETAEQYFRRVENMLADPKSYRLSDRQLELAWCYAEVFFFRWSQPFPWNVTTFWADLKKWPMARVLSEEGQAKFGRTFDLLVGRNEGASS